MAYDPKGKSNKELNEARLNIHNQAKQFHAENESNWTKECEEKFNGMMADVSDIKAIIDRRNQLASFETSEGSKLSEGDLGKGKEKQVAQKVMIRSGLDQNGKPLYRSVDVGSERGSQIYNEAISAAISRKSLSAQQMAALQSDSETQAGFLLMSEQMAAGILKDVDDLVFVRRYAKIHTVLEAGKLGIRKRTARANTFGWSSELVVSTDDSTLAYGKKILEPHPLTGAIKVSRDLARRSAGTVTDEVLYELGRNSAEKMEDGYLTGNGAQQPLGVFTASSDGISTSRDSVTGSSTSITADGLLNAKFSLKGQYRSNSLGQVRWLFHRDGIKIVSKLKDSTNQYLWQPGLQAGQPDMLLGYPVDESERSPNTFTSGNYVGLLANWNYYEIADALDIEIQVLNELYAGTNQLGYIGRLKTDGCPTIEEAFVRLKCD